MKNIKPVEIDRTLAWFCIFSLVIIELVVLAIIFGRPELIGTNGFRWDIEMFYPKAGIEGIKEQLARPDPRTSNDYSVVDLSTTIEITPIRDIVVQSIEDTAMKVSPSDDGFPLTITVERVEPYSSASNCKYHVSTTRFIKYKELDAKVLEANETHVECEVKIV